MIDPIQRILSALRGHGHEPHKAGAGWGCRCPAHDDRNPSLSIHAGDDGRALVNCHAGCTVDAVCGAIGLRPADLFADDPSRGNGYAPRPRRGVTVTSTARKPAHGGGIGDRDAKAYSTAREAVAALEQRNGPRSALWTYHNAAGGPVGLVVRWNVPADPSDPESKPSKRILPVNRTAKGWAGVGMPTPRPLYGLPALLAAAAGSRVYVVEGEKAADAARARGLLATTSPHGSKSASKADWSPLAGMDVVILPDHDDAGEKYTADVVRLAMGAGARSVRIVRLTEIWAGMPEGGDMADLVNHRGGEVEAIRAEVEALVDRTEAETVTPEAPDGGAVPAFKPFPVDVLPEPIRSFVVEGAKAMGCDPSYIALPLLSALASAIGNTRRIELKRGWTEPTILWTGIVGDSGTLKTPAFKSAMKAIRKAQAQAFKEYQATLVTWEAEHLRYEVELTAWKRRAAKGDAGDPPEKPAPPIARRYIVSDTTVEALAPILMDNPRGVLLARDEIAGWLGSFDRYSKGGKGGGDSAHWLSMHNGEEMTVDRKTGTPRTIHVPSASVSIAGGIQPGILARAMGQEHHESGMLARLLFAMPLRKVKRWTEADMDPATEAALVAVIDRLLSLTMDVDPDSPELEPDYRPRVMTMAPDGKAAWVTFYNEHAREQADLSGDLSAAWSKLEGYAARLALVIHLIRWAAGDATLSDPARVDVASIAAGVVLARWFGDEARRVYAIVSESDADRETRRLVEWIERRGGAVTANELAHGVRAFRGDTDAARAALAELVADGRGRWELVQGAKGGRPTERFRLASAVPVTETPPIPENDGGIGDSDTGDTATNADSEWGEL